MRIILALVRHLPRVAVTIGLSETILFRAASHLSLGQESSLDVALNITLLGLISGERSKIEDIAELAMERNCPQFSKGITKHILEQHTTFSLEIDPIL